MSGFSDPSCIVFGTNVLMSDGSVKLAEDIVPGDNIVTIAFGDDSMDVDHNPMIGDLTEWKSLDNSNWSTNTGTVASMSFLADSSYYSINGSLNVTYEHHILIKKELTQEYIFVRAEEISVGDYLIKKDFSEEEITSVVFENDDILSVCIDTSPFNMFVAGNEYIVHNEGGFGQNDGGGLGYADETGKKGGTGKTVTIHA
jgi:hypothetical protein